MWSELDYIYSPRASEVLLSICILYINLIYILLHHEIDESNWGYLSVVILNAEISRCRSRKALLIYSSSLSTPTLFIIDCPSMLLRLKGFSHWSAGFRFWVWAWNILGHPHMLPSGAVVNRIVDHPCVASTQLKSCPMGDYLHLL